MLARFHLAVGPVSIGGNVLFMLLFEGQAGLSLAPATLLSIACCSIANFALADRFVFARAAASSRVGVDLERRRSR